MKVPFKMKGFSGFGNSPLPQDVKTKTKSTKRVDRSRSRLLLGGDASKLTYTTKAGDEVEAIDVIKKSKKGKKGNVKKVKEVVLHDGGKSKTKRIQKVTKSGKVKTKTITWRDGKRVVTKTTSDKVDQGPILQKLNKSEKIGPVESPEAIEKKKENVKYHSVFTPGSKGRIKAEKEHKEAKAYKKT